MQLLYLDVDVNKCQLIVDIYKIAMSNTTQDNILSINLL
jgi:hypothetical protein